MRGAMSACEVSSSASLFPTDFSVRPILAGIGFPLDRGEAQRVIGRFRTRQTACQNMLQWPRGGEAALNDPQHGHDRHHENHPDDSRAAPEGQRRTVTGCNSNPRPIAAVMLQVAVWNVTCGTASAIGDLTPFGTLAPLISQAHVEERPNQEGVAVWKDSRLFPVSLLAFACLAMTAPETVLARGGGGGAGRWGSRRWRRVWQR